MRVGLISDLHGNAVALGAVIDDLDRSGVDWVICLGDVASLGPQPREVLAMLRQLGCACVLGNHDAYLLDPATCREPETIQRAEDWCRARLDADDLAFLAGFVPSLELRLDGGAVLLAVHGSPRSHQEDVLATTPPEELDAMLGGRRPAVMAAGHTHLQMLRQHRGLLLVNPGSVGMPFREPIARRSPPEILPHAEYAIVSAGARGLGVELKRVAYDVAAARAAMAATDHPFNSSVG